MRKLNVTENLVGFPPGETLNLQVRTWVVDARRIEGLRAQGVGWKAISRGGLGSERSIGSPEMVCPSPKQKSSNRSGRQSGFHPGGKPGVRLIASSGLPPHISPTANT